MNTRDFLELILPIDGWLFTASKPPGKGWFNVAHQTIDEAVRATEKLTADQKNAFFALASYKKDRYWDAAAQQADGTVGKWRNRTQANALSLKAFWLDLDVDPADPKKYTSKEDCITELQQFCKHVGLPRPLVVDSGGGIHAYWPLTEPLPAAEWKATALLFKALVVETEFMCDTTVIADEARVLRTVGGINHKVQYTPRPVHVLGKPAGPYPFALIDAAIREAANLLQVSPAPLPSGQDAKGTLPPPPLAAHTEDNLGATNDPLHFDRIAYGCAQIGIQAGCRGAGISEPLWHCGIGIVKFCDPQDLAAAAISDGHAQYNPHATRAKLDAWKAGPTTCEKFRTANKAICDACPHYGKITSPAQLGRDMHEAPAPEVEAQAAAPTVDDPLPAPQVVQIPDPPHPYKRRLRGALPTDIVIESEDEEGTRQFIVVSPYDLYPIKILRQNGDDAHVDERSVWRAHLPRMGAVDMELHQPVISDAKRLFAYLLGKGLYMSPEQAKLTQAYMSAYLQTLATSADREKLYERLGWHADRTSFVLGTRVLHRDGTATSHEPSKTVKAVTKEGVHPAGSLDAWKEAAKFYAGPGMEGPRMFMYGALAAPLFHMTGHKGVLMTAAGESGRGKTTVLKACASMWGNPEHLILNGNKDGATTNALYEHLGTYHSLPFLLDDTTEREPEEIRRLMLNLSQGMGKERMKGSEHSGHSVRWETIVMSTANTDDITRIMSTSKDVDPHLMRFISVDFALLDTRAEAKLRADRFIRDIGANFGHVGPIFMGTVVKEYDKIKRLMERNLEMVTRKVDSSNSSGERLWLATVAACYTAAQVAKALGLLDYPYEHDLDWMCAHLGGQREAIMETKATSTELLSTFLESHFSHAIILSAKQASNLDNVSHRPTGQLLIRHELDAGIMYVARSAIMEYCNEIKVPFKRFEKELLQDGVIIEANKMKVLGADTIYSKGQTRCWRLDATKLAEGVTKRAVEVIHEQQAEDAAAEAAKKNARAAKNSNVVPLHVKAA